MRLAIRTPESSDRHSRGELAACASEPIWIEWRAIHERLWLSSGMRSGVNGAVFRGFAVRGVKHWSGCKGARRRRRAARARCGPPVHWRWERRCILLADGSHCEPGLAERWFLDV